MLQQCRLVQREFRQVRPESRCFLRRATTLRHLALLLTVLAGCQAQPATGPQFLVNKPTQAPYINVYFSPNGGCQNAIVTECGKAKKEIRVACYSFTNEPIAEALGAAAKRGVDVRMIVDHKSSLEAGCKIPEVLKAGVKVWTDDTHAIFHNKYIVYDGSVVSTGSFNLSHNAQAENAENLVGISGDTELAKEFLDNWSEHLKHSKEVK